MMKMLNRSQKSVALMAAMVIGGTFILPEGMDVKAHAASTSSSLLPEAASQVASASDDVLSSQDGASVKSSFTVTPVEVNGKVKFISHIN